MEVTVEDVMKLTSAQNCTVVAGKMGLCKTVRWFLGMLSPIVDPWVHGHEVLFVYGSGMDLSESSLIFLLEQCAVKEVSALIFIIGPFFTKIPESVVQRGDELKLPIITMPNEVPIVDFTKEIAELIMQRHRIWDEKGILLKNLIFGHESNYEKYEKMLEKFEDSIHIDEYMNIISIRLNEENTMQESFVANDIEQIILMTFGKIMYFFNDDREIVLLINNPQRDIALLEKKCYDFIKQCSKTIDFCITGIGIGNTVPNVMGVSESYSNAVKALDNIKYSDDIVISYESLSNVKKLLSEIQSVQVLKYCFQDTIGKLLEYDSVHSSDLLNTLRTYLEEDGNILKSSQKLFIHRNTMVYRINKINDILGVEISKKTVMWELDIALCCYDKYLYALTNEK